ncbi:MAG: glycosyltransferase family 1 protein [Patescibacteria group bacterium]|jgi:glycosyltransferase involved in cell wall biosynthesis
MRIGIDARSLLEPHPSGVSFYTQQLIRALLALPDRTDTLVLFTSGWSKPKLEFPSEVEWHHLPWPNKLFHGLSLFGLAPKIDRILGGVDVLFLPNWNFFPHSRKIPYVLTVHDCALYLYPHLLSRKQRLWHRLIQPTRLMKQAKHIITVSQSTQQDVKTNHVTTILSGPPQRVASALVPNLPDNYVVMFGGRDARKNIPVLPNINVVIIGDGSPLGYLTEAQKWYVLEHAQALVYPSLYEGFGFPPLEAWQAGVPVIASFAGAIPEICGQAALYVNPYSNHDIQLAVTTVLQDERLRTRLIEAGKEQLKKFSWEQTARDTLRVLRQAVY